MEQNLEQQYEDFFSMFSTNGWKQFIEDMEDIYDTYRIEDIKDEQQLNFVKGERSILWRIMTLEESMKNAYDMLQEDD
ncbi:MAG: hypothetical protein VW270_01630 [Candidatus Poseidoniales archaeon]